MNERYGVLRGPVRPPPRSFGGTEAMRRLAAGLACGLLVSASGTALVHADPPPLDPPVVNPSQPEPRAEPAPRVAPTPRADNRPMLVIPGVNTPKPRTVPAPAPVASELPPLIGPKDDAAKPEGAPRSAPRWSDLKDDPTPRRGSAPPPRSLDSFPSAFEDLPEPKSDARDRPQPRPAPARRGPGLFGRFLPPVLNDRGSSARGDVLSVEPRSDPAADAALKRRLEKQVEESLGSRVRNVDVRITGRQVVIHAESTRFWQRRAVRSALEALPGLNGYKTTVRVDE